MVKNIDIEKFTEIKVDIKEIVQKIGEENANELTNNVKSNAQTILDKGYATGVYKEGWIVEPTDEGAIMKNTGKHRTLSHLLENGHRTRSGSFVPPQPHIRPAYQKAKTKYINDLKDIDFKIEID